MVGMVLRSVGSEQGYAFDRQVRDYYYKPEMLGDPEKMVYGSIDVS